MNYKTFLIKTDNENGIQKIKWKVRKIDSLLFDKISLIDILESLTG